MSAAMAWVRFYAMVMLKSGKQLASIRQPCLTRGTAREKSLNIT